MRSMFIALLLAIGAPTFASDAVFKDEQAGFSLAIPEGMNLAWTVVQGKGDGLKAHVYSSPFSLECTRVMIVAKYPLGNLTNETFASIYSSLQQQFSLVTGGCFEGEDDEDWDDDDDEFEFSFEESLRQGDNPGERYRFIALDEDLNTGADAHIFVENHHVFFVVTGLITNGSFESLEPFSRSVVNSIEFSVTE